MLEALRQRESGLTAEEMVAWAEEARYFVQTLFMVDDLDALHRGGRIPASVAFAVIKHNIGATIGSHVGAGMVSISFWGTDRREALSVADKIARKVRKGE